MARLSILLRTFLAALCASTDFGSRRTDYFEGLGDAPGLVNPPPVNSDGGVICIPSRFPRPASKAPAANPLGSRVDNSFGLSQGRVVGTPQIAGIWPHSGTHDILTQRPAAGSLATSGRCLLLRSLYVGCTTADVQAAANKPLSCLLTLTSFDGKGKQSAVQKATYTPNGVPITDTIR